MKWINAIGLILQFFAFWFAAPELLGAKTLKRFEVGLKKMISSLPIIIMMILSAGYGLSLGVAGMLKGMKGAKEGLSESEFNTFVITLAVCFALYGIFMIFFKRIKKWLETRVARPLIDGLITNNQIRSTALIIGAALFSLGFFIQLFVVLIS